MVLFICVLVFMPVVPAGAGAAIGVCVDGEDLLLDVPPIIVSGRTLVPLRGVFEALGAAVHWVPETRTVVVESNGRRLELPVGAQTAMLDGMHLALDVPARIHHNRTMVPIRFVSETLGAKVHWLAHTRTVVVESMPLPFQHLREVAAYYVQFSETDLKSFASLQEAHQHLSNVITFQYRLDGEGNLEQVLVFPEFDQLRQQHGLSTLALIHNIGPAGSFDRDWAHQLLANDEHRQRAVQAILALMRSGDYRGVNIDLENIPPADRARYTDFIKELTTALRPDGYLVTLAVPAKTRDDPNHGWSGAFDYAALGQYADQIMLMTYDQHYAYSGPGPVAGVDWMERVLQYATQVIPTEKLLLGVPTYGYCWPESGGNGKSLSSRAALAEVMAGGITVCWDSAAQVPFYRAQGSITYFEDYRSLRAKLYLVEKYKLSGIAIWRLGYEDARIWQEISAGLK